MTNYVFEDYNPNTPIVADWLNQVEQLRRNIVPVDGQISSDISSFTQDTGAEPTVAGTVQAKLRTMVSVKDAPFNATGDGSTNDTFAIQAAIDYVQSAGGGSIFFPRGVYQVHPNTLLINAPDISMVLYGEGPTASQLNGIGDGWRLGTDIPNSNLSFLSIRGLGFNGDGGLNPAGIGLYLGGVITQGEFSDLAFVGCDIGLQLENVFTCTFKNLRFRNYNTGLRGTTSFAAQHNTFLNCYFSDGRVISPATAKPISSNAMGNNTYIECDFESSGYIASVDMRGGAGFDTMINCRFERCNVGTSSWLIPGDRGLYLNTILAPSDPNNCVGTSAYMIDIGGQGNVFDGVLTDGTLGANTLRFQSTARQNKVVFDSLLSNDTYAAVYNLVTDVSQGDNVTEWPGGGVTKNTIAQICDTWGGGPVNQFIEDSMAWSTFTTSGLVNSAGPAGSTQQALGPLGYGYTRDLNTPSAAKKGYWSFSATAGYTYIFSVFFLPKVAGDTIDMAGGSNLASPTWRNTPLPDTAKWQRCFIAIRATSTATHYFQIRTNGGTGVYAAFPMLEEWINSADRLGPSGLVLSTVSTGAQDYAYLHNPTPVSKQQMYGTDVPAVGRFTQGDIMWNMGAVSGDPPGWMCTVSGAPGTWTAMANLA